MFHCVKAATQGRPYKQISSKVSKSELHCTHLLYRNVAKIAEHPLVRIPLGGCSSYQMLNVAVFATLERYLIIACLKLAIKIISQRAKLVGNLQNQRCI